jgi:hypothetical protein
MAELLRELEEDVLGHVLGIGVLKLPLPAPAGDVPTVALDELTPSTSALALGLARNSFGKQIGETTMAAAEDSYWKVRVDRSGEGKRESGRPHAVTWSPTRPRTGGARRCAGRATSSSRSMG